MAISIVFVNNGWSRMYIRYGTIHIIFIVHKAGLLFCFEGNIRSLRKITQFPFYADLVLEFLYLCQKKILFTSENSSNHSWQAYLILSVDDNNIPLNKKSV